MLLTVLFSLVVVSGAFAQITPNFGSGNSQAQDSVGLSLSFTSTGNYTIDVVDAGGTSITDVDTTGASLDAAGTDKILVGKAYLDVSVGGTWEIVTYTDNLAGTNPVDVTPALIEANGGLLHDTLDLNIPLKIRTEGIEGAATTDAVGAALTDNQYTVTGEYGYVPELVDETVLGNGPKVIAQIGLTPSSVLDLMEVAFAVDESTAGSGNYATTIYFDVRGN